MDVMRITIQLPDDISAALEERWDDVPRRSLEAIAVEAYRSGALAESQVRRLLGLESRLGSIAVGRDADLVALTGDVFELNSAIRWTMTDGVKTAEEQ